jgi:hypothetical protein
METPLCWQSAAKQKRQVIHPQPKHYLTTPRLTAALQ